MLDRQAEFSSPQGPDYGRSRFYYSPNYFRTNLIIAAGLTLLVCFLTYLALAVLMVYRVNLYTALTGIIFFAFVSARSILAYLRRETVLAVLPSGLIDNRLGAEPILWPDIKQIFLKRSENEFHLAIYLWPRDRSGQLSLQASSGADYMIDLTPLDGDLEKILQSVSRYKQVTID